MPRSSRVCGDVTVRIGILTHHYDPEESTPQRRWSTLVQHFVRDGHDVIVFAPPLHGPGAGDRLPAQAPPRGEREVGQHGETIYRTRYLNHNADLASRALDQLVVASDAFRLAWRKLREDRPDVLISTAPSLPSTVAGWFAAKLLRVPHIAEMRDAWPDLIRDSNFLRNASLRRRLAARATRKLVTSAQREAAAVVTTTDSFSRVLVQRGVARAVTIRNANWASIPPVPNRRGERAGALRIL